MPDRMPSRELRMPQCMALASKPLTVNALALTRPSLPAGVWGLGRTARAGEQLPVRCFELLDKGEHARLHALSEVLAFVSLTLEPEAIVGAHESGVPRLHPAAESFESSVRLDFHSRGAISNLYIAQLGGVPVVECEVELQVRAVGLNFRDVLNVLGEYPGDPGPPGLDCYVVAMWLLSDCYVVATWLLRDCYVIAM